MNKFISLKKLAGTSAAIAMVSLLTATAAHAAVFAPISSRMGVGSRGNEVIKLQTFLASDHNIYPDGRVTGYYGNLTRAAVMQFQLQYGISMVGNVGPATLAKINNVINQGYGIDIYSPSIYNVSVQKTNTTASFSWATTESARGKVYYSPSPFGLMEAVGNFTEPSVSGGLSMMANNMQSNQSITVSNLQPNTLYYYMIVATDASGNVSVTNPGSLMTNN